jgi:lipoyl-dependent peroxiredoxin
MPVRRSEAVWEGDLRKGRGVMTFGSGAFTGPYSFASRFESGPGTNPEELLGAAHAGCFSMALAAELDGGGYRAEYLHTTAKVHIDQSSDGFTITQIALETEGFGPGIDDKVLQQFAEKAKVGCPLSRALAATHITLTTKALTAKPDTKG